MSHLIDKDPLIVEIVRRRDAALMRQHNLEIIGQQTCHNEMIANELNRVLQYIDTLEVKNKQKKWKIIVKIVIIMTLDEAIKHCEEIVCKNNECKEDYKQLASWLKELKCLRQVVDKRYIDGLRFLQEVYPYTFDKYFRIELRRDMTGMFRRDFSDSEMAEILKGRT